MPYSLCIKYPNVNPVIREINNIILINLIFFLTINFNFSYQVVYYIESLIYYDIFNLPYKAGVAKPGQRRWT